MIATHQAHVRIDGAMVDSASVVSGLPDASHPQHHIEVQVGANVLLHELQQCGVSVSEETLHGFLVSDARDERGRSAYLTIARAVAAEPGRLPSDPRWRWTGTSDVQLQDGVVTFSGTATDI